MTVQKKVKRLSKKRLAENADSVEGYPSAEPTVTNRWVQTKLKVCVIMATVKLGYCPTCGNERQLAYFQFGVVKSTMCISCLHRYLEKIVIPVLQKSNNSDTSTDNCMIGVVSND